MYTRLKTTHLAIFSAFCLLLLLPAARGLAATDQQPSENMYTLSEVKTDVGDDTLTITMAGDTAPAYTSRELYDPYRLIIDIAEVKFADGLDMENLLPENKFATLQTTVVRGLKPEITRFIFTINEGFRQTVERQGNDLVVNILPTPTQAEEAGQAMVQETGDTAAMTAAGQGQSDTGSAKIRELLNATIQTAGEDGGGSMGAERQLEKSFDFSGYKRERISVDFYKVDLHNVFRLFRQVSGLNLIVAEGVEGTLTLALNDVPWDFALDVILNLTELEKEERFNTIIIYPKDKEFDWPKRAADNLSFEANLDVVEQEALIIEQSANQPKEVIEAKELMRKARKEERNDNYEDAVALYAEANELWPTNAKLSSKLAAIYLVRLGMNAKAIYYATKSLEVDPQNYKASLYAAIGMANMNRTSEAVEYFSRSISGDPPMKEALASFAAFSESVGRYTAALQLYDKYHEHYGMSVNTMVAKARIYDKLGLRDDATEQYKAVLASGFPLQVGLREYIQTRLAEAQ